ncbi:hypothetical protein BGW39_011700 [Mortierella sp. 14UC]|nr:hypothetical protein BGW39_011700 [Mortierella sp. 14UC]
MDSIPASIEDLEFAYWDPIYYSQRIRSELEEEGDKDGDESGQQEQRPFSMHTTSSCDVHGNSSSRTTPKSPTAALLPNLKRLSFKSHALTHQKQTLHQLLVRCPNLETVQLYDNPKIVPLRLFSLLLRQHCPKLQDLFVMHDLRNFSDEELRDVLDASTAGWRSLGFPRAPHESHEFDSLSIAALLRHAGTIENLRIDGCDCLTSATIQQILCSAPKLKRFDTLLMDRSRRADIELKAADIIAGKPWVCTELESLKIRIVGVSRPDLVKRSNGRPLDGPLHRGSMEESRRIQRVIYEQLGRLTSLKQLILGHDEVEVDHICRNYEKATEGREYA